MRAQSVQRPAEVAVSMPTVALTHPPMHWILRAVSLGSSIRSVKLNLCRGLERWSLTSTLPHNFKVQFLITEGRNSF
jgi:hypothetical protein